MQTHFIEACNVVAGGEKFNWGKFAVCRFDSDEWARPSVVDTDTPFGIYPPRSLLRAMGHASEHVWVLDLATREGACFRPGGYAPADLKKHRIWGCVLFEPFLAWLYKQDLTDLTKLPTYVEFSAAEAPPGMYGHRSGPEPAQVIDMDLDVKLDSNGVWPGLRAETGIKLLELAELGAIWTTTDKTTPPVSEPVVALRIDLGGGRVAVAETTVRLFLTAAAAMRAHYGESLWR